MLKSVLRSEESVAAKSDWTANWVGKGASFGIECDGKKVLAGVKAVYDAEVGDYGWKGMCLYMKHN